MSCTSHRKYIIAFELLFLAVIAIIAVCAFLDEDRNDKVVGGEAPVEDVSTDARRPLENTDPPPTRPIATVAARPDDAVDRQVEGDVIDAAGRPIADAEIRVHAVPPESKSRDLSSFHDDVLPPLETTRSDERGEFTLMTIPPGIYAVEVRASGFGTSRVPYVAIGTGAGRLRFVLDGGCRLEGRILRADRSPVEGAIVGGVGLPRGARPSSMTWAASTSDAGPTLADGRFVLDGVAAGPGALVVRLGPLVYMPTHEIFYAPSAAPIEIVLPQSCRIEGRVTDAQGSAVRGARITFSQWTSNGMFGIDTKVDDDGCYVADGLEPSESTSVGVFAEGYAPYSDSHDAWNGRGGIVTKDGANVFDFVMQRGRSISGLVVRKSDGAPMPGMSVGFVPRGAVWPFIETTTDGIGRYRLVGIPSDSGVLVAKSHGWTMFDRGLVGLVPKSDDIVGTA